MTLSPNYLELSASPLSLKYFFLSHLDLLESIYTLVTMQYLQHVINDLQYEISVKMMSASSYANLGANATWRIWNGGDEGDECDMMMVTEINFMVRWKIQLPVVTNAQSNLKCKICRILYLKTEDYWTDPTRISRILLLRLRRDRNATLQMHCCMHFVA